MIAWFATNHVAANLVMGFAVLAGLAAMSRIPVKVFPDIEFPYVMVNVVYLGAAPEEVESGVCLRIEQEIEGVTGIKRVIAFANEGICTVQIELFVDADVAAAQSEIESRINAVDTFPAETERAVVRFVEYSSLVMEVAVTGPRDERTLKELGRRVRDDLAREPNISSVVLANTRPYEISVEVSEASLLRNGLTFDDVAAAVRMGSVDLPGGSIKTEDGELLLRTSGERHWGEELEELTVISRSDGTRVRLKDVARVVDGFADTGQALTFDGEPAALIQVMRVGDQSLQEIAETVKRYVAESASKYPEGVRLTLWRDESVILTDRLGTLIDSGVQGLLLVLLILALFLRPHLALWVSAGIPTAFLGGIFLVYVLGYSIDAVSVVGFIIALGMLVDDAVVVGESVYVAQQRGGGDLAGAIAGSQRVLVPVTFGVLTTAAAFMPLVLATGLIGEMMAVTGITVLACLLFSLIECQMVLPAHLGHRSSRIPLGEFGLTFLLAIVIASFAFAPSMRTGAGIAVGATVLVWAAHRLGGLSRLAVAYARLQSRLEAGLQWFIENPVRRLAEATLRARALTLAVAFVALLSAFAIVGGGHLPFSMALPAETDRVVARLTMPLGVSPATTAGAVAQLTGKAQVLAEELAGEFGQDMVRHVMVATGSQPSTASVVSGLTQTTGSHLAEVTMQLSPSEGRPIKTGQIADRWRESVGEIAQAAALDYLTEIEGFGSGIEIRVSGDDLDDLRDFAAEIRQELASYPGVFGVSDSYRVGKAELRLSVTPAGEALGITLADLGRQVRQAFYGEEVHRIQRGQDEVRVMVRYPTADRSIVDSLASLRIRSPGGAAVPFRTVAEAALGRGYASIERTDGRRSLLVNAAVDPNFTDATSVQQQLDGGFLAATAAKYPGVSYRVEGLAVQQETAESLGPLFFMAMFAIFALLAIPLKSYAQPLIVMSVLPFAFVGAVWGHIIMKPFGDITGLSAPSVFGVIAACGVAVNATLVLLHTVNANRAAGDSLHDALVKGVVERCRPIVITSVTTFGGVAPLMLSKSVQALPLIPMAISLAFGVLFSAVAALFVVPTFWLALHNVSRGARRVGGLLGELVGSAPRMSMWMARYPYIEESLRQQEFVDLQIDEDLGLAPEAARVAQRGLVRLFYEREFDRTEMRQQLDAIAARTPLVDDLVGEVRIWAEQRTFQVGVHMLRGAITPADAARPISDILYAGLGTLMSAAKVEFASENGEVPGGRVALVALGAAGRREFAIGSDFGMLLLHDHGPVPAHLGLDPDAWHAQFRRRITRLAEELSADGILYRPGPLSPTGGAQGSPWGMGSFTAFRQYFETSPSTADLRMLVHARVIDGEAGLDADFEELRRSVLTAGRDARTIVAELEAERPGYQTAVWDVVDRPGGLADLELAAEALQLGVGGRAPEVLVSGIAATFAAAAGASELESGAARRLAEAATLWQNIDGFIRMSSGSGAFDPESLPPDQRATLAEVAGVASFEAMPDAIAATAQYTARIVAEVLDGSGYAAQSGPAQPAPER